jgi:hypothetical protein
MTLETPGKMDSLPIPKQYEVSLDSKKDLENLENQLKSLIGTEEAEQCVFALRSMAEDDFTNHCNDATKEFGRRLATKFGGEESFFELAPDANFSEIRSNQSLDETGYQGDYHSVGLLEFKLKNKSAASLIFDLTYGNVSNKSSNNSALVLYSPTAEKQAIDMLKNRYGGLWKKEFRFDQETGKFIFQEN